MKNEDKQLLFKDLCARLPYGVMINIKSKYNDNREIIKLNGYHLFEYSYNIVDRGLKPYIRPMSSITEKEKNELRNRFYSYKNEEIWAEVDYYNAHHLDYRGLIPMGLALEAPENMYKL